MIVERPEEDDRVFTYSYDAAGRLEEIEYPEETEIKAVFRDGADTPGSGFDANGNLLFLRYEKDSTLLRRFEWTYDDSNNRESMLEVTPTKAVKWDYGYDWLDRLITVKRAEAADVGSLGATALQREYVFDESDNRVFFDDYVNGVTYHYVYKSALDGDSILRHSDQIEEIQIYDQAAGHRTVGDFVTFETFESDEDGNMTKRVLASSGEEISYTWTEFDRLERIESDQEGRMQDARYDVDGLRERKLDKNGNSSVEYGVGIITSASKPASSTSSAPTISYLMGHMLLGAEIDGEFRYHLGDALSSVRDVVDDNGTVIHSFEWDEYGNLLSSSGSGTVSPKTWVGGLSVNDDTADSGMFNMGHRNYAAGVLGRFISRDPIGFNGSSLNLYAYPTNPLRFVDPDGLEVRAVFDTSTGTMTVTTTEGDRRVYQNVFSGDKSCLNNLEMAHIPGKGPVPPGVYFLGDPVDVAPYHEGLRGDTMWLPIINQNTHNDRVSVTDPRTGQVVERNQMYVHPGTISMGCLTFRNRDNAPGEIGNPDFTELKEFLANTSRLTAYRRRPWSMLGDLPVSYPGILIVK